MTTMENPRDKVVAYLKAATTLQSADEIATATKLGEGRVANILNALRTDKQIDSRKVGDGKKKTVMKYWFTGEGIAAPCADRPALKPVNPEKTAAPRALTNELIALMQKHPPKTEFRAEALTALLNSENPGQPLTSQVVSQRLKSMTGRHTGTTKHIIADGDQKRPGGRDYYLTYYLLHHPAENAAAGLEDGAREADEVVIPPPPEYDPASVAFFPAEIIKGLTAGDSEGGETDAPAPMIVAMTSSGGPADPLDDIRHVLSLPDDMPADKVAEAVRLRVAGLTRSVQDLQNQLAAISIALQQSGIDLENQSPVESIQALNGAIKILKDELDRKAQPVLVPIKNVSAESIADQALRDLRATIAGTGATLTIREQSDVVGVIYHRNFLAVARPGRELIEVVEAIRTLNQHTPRQEAA